ncbi:MAG TPA: hypothetical protein VK169_10970 [Saprospiraceae bacterium]|nr:hypothetical protein [Saprospiraceae bacterium]
MYKLEFTLKQHTPIIHFQHDQDGATLRSTEVKPKLDRFLIEIYKDNKHPIDFKEWLIGKGEKEVLDYKIIIEPVINVEHLIEKGSNFGSFFGSMGDEYESNPKSANIASNNIKCHIFCLKSDLITSISDHLNNFFALNNFGTRQNKGFGCFTVVDINTIPQNFPLTLFSYHFELDFRKDRIDLDEQKILAEQIDIFYRSLRSGLNLKGKNGEKFYFKSALFMYLNSQSIQWDKKTIKATYFNKDDIQVSETYFDRKDNEEKHKKGSPFDIIYLKTQQNFHAHNGITPDILDSPRVQDDAHSEKLFRDRLGLSNDEKWFSYRNSLKKTEAKKQGNNWVRKENNDDPISRYKSPLLFKIIIDEKTKKAKVFFDVFEDIETLSIYESSMFNLLTKPNKTAPSLNPEVSLFMPIADRLSFNIKSFLDFAFENIEPTRHIKKTNTLNFQMKIASETLNSVYAQLKKYLKHGQ